jgi:MgtC family
MLNPSANVTMEYRELLTVALDFGTAILLGALIGIEREKRKAEDEETGHIAGLRTFILLALLGAAAGWFSRDLSTPWVLAAALLIVGAVVVAGYFVTARPGQDGKGLTTEVAAVIVFLLGAMIMLGYEELAIGLGVITAAVLAYKQPLHGFVEKLGWDDVYAGVRLLIATFIALPLLPNEPIDPWGALKIGLATNLQRQRQRTRRYRRWQGARHCHRTGDKATCFRRC